MAKGAFVQSKPVSRLGENRLYYAIGALVAAGGIAALVPASTGQVSGYRDDTHHALHTARRAVELRGEQKLERIRFAYPDGASSVALDIRRATFTVANSRNLQPTPVQKCDQGTLPVNRYPLLIARQHTAVVGGLFLSRVPQSTEWSATYCNSAAITFKDAPNGVVDGVRIAGAWDAIRAGRGAPDLKIVNSWITNARDDAIENDHLQSATIVDTLIDGAYQGISVKQSKSKMVDASGNVVTLSGVLIFLQEYNYKGTRRLGALMKGDQRSPRLRIVNSVIAMDPTGDRSYPNLWMTSWSKLTDSSNNLFLWLSDAPIPDFVPRPPSSFRVLRGQAARDAWTRAKRNWINCHPKLARLSSDPRSNPESCVAGTWGGFTE